MNDNTPREETRAYQNDRESQVRDMASWPCNHTLTLMDAARICYAGHPELLARLERAEKIDRLKAELANKAEELRQEQLAAAYEGVEVNMADGDVDRMLADLAHDHQTEARSYEQKRNPHDD